MNAKEYLELKGVFSLDTKKRYNEVINWMEEYAQHRAGLTVELTKTDLIALVVKTVGMNSKNITVRMLKKQLREAVANYMYSEGCSCCQNVDAHKKHAEALAKLLSVKKYSDGSGFDFHSYRTGADKDTKLKKKQ